MHIPLPTGWLAAALGLVAIAVLLLGPPFNGPADARAKFKCPKPSAMASISKKKRAARAVKRKIGSDYQIKKVKRLRHVARWRKFITRECGRRVTARTVYVFADYKLA